MADVEVNALREPPTPMIYYSADQSPVGVFSIVARTPGDPAGLAGALRSVMLEVRPSLPVTRQLALDGHVGSGLAGLRAATALMSGFSLLALLLAGTRRTGADRPR